MTFTTATGSRYEIDTEGKRVRRLGGRAEPTPRQGVDGQWRTYADCTELRVGVPVVFVWSLEGRVPSTVTSLVVAVSA